MKVAVQIEDRDLGYVIMDVDSAPTDLPRYEFELDTGITLLDVMVDDDTNFVWLMSDTNIKVVCRAGYDFNGDFAKMWPVASMNIVMNHSEIED